jgi:hypothetical protein
VRAELDNLRRLAITGLQTIRRTESIWHNLVFWQSRPSSTLSNGTGRALSRAVWQGSCVTRREVSKGTRCREGRQN